jgi:transposase
VLSYKRLERGRFRLPVVPEQAKSVEMDSTQLAMLLDGTDMRTVRRSRAWRPPGPTSPTYGHDHM